MPEPTCLPETIEIPSWWSNGTMMFRTETLPHDHDHHPYNYVKRVYGVSPEAYGISKPINPYEQLTKHELFEYQRERYGLA